jgi:hypothetical protein
MDTAKGGNAMTDEMRKRLTKYLGECWHECSNQAGPSETGYGYLCVHCKKDMLWQGKDLMPDNRTFTTPDDMIALSDKIKAKGEWEQFENYCFPYYNLHPIPMIMSFTEWLIDPETFINLVAEWRKGKDT